jgi:glutamyl-tRNA synthetase
MKSQTEIRVRIAPSPTGKLHIGTARTALFNYLYARHCGGKFILRSEDTDPERSKKEFESEIMENLKWLGIDWDEGPDISGPYAPYRQTERIERQQKYLRQLLDENKAYWCFCATEELENEKKSAQEKGEISRYSGKCSNLSRDEAETRINKGERAVIRFRTPANEEVVFEDLIRGEIKFNTSALDDMIIATSLERPLYNFAVVIDDFEMGITDIIRGEDHISNTPKQILFLRALGLDIPRYGHLPLILGPDKTKMSKRHGAVGLEEYKEQGYLPEAMFNFFALLGWNPNTDEELLSKEEIIKRFEIGDIQKAGAIFNREKLDWMNGAYIRKLESEELLARTLPFWRRDLKKYDDARLVKILAIAKDRMRRLSDINELTEFFFSMPPYDREVLLWKDMKPEDAVSVLEKIYNGLTDLPVENFTAGKLDAYLSECAANFSNKGYVYWPLRTAITGLKASPPPVPIMEILGKEETLKRIEAAIKILRK